MFVMSVGRKGIKMKKINFVLGLIGTIAVIAMIGSMFGNIISNISNIYGKVCFGALGLLLITAVVGLVVME